MGSALQHTKSALHAHIQEMEKTPLLNWKYSFRKISRQNLIRADNKLSNSLVEERRIDGKFSQESDEEVKANLSVSGDDPIDSYSIVKRKSITENSENFRTEILRREKFRMTYSGCHETAHDNWNEEQNYEKTAEFRGFCYVPNHSIDTWLQHTPVGEKLWLHMSCFQKLLWQPVSRPRRKLMTKSKKVFERESKLKGNWRRECVHSCKRTLFKRLVISFYISYFHWDYKRWHLSYHSTQATPMIQKKRLVVLD